MATLLRHKNGTFYARHIFRENGQRREKRETLKTKDERTARRRLAKWAAINIENQWGDNKITFDAVATKFIRIHCAALAPNTVARYETCLRQLRPFFGSKLITDIKPRDLLAFETKRRADGGRRSTQRKKVPLAAASIKKDLMCLSSIMSYAVMEGWTEVNPVPLHLRKRKAAGLTDGEPRRRYLSEPEEARLIAALMATPRAKPRLEDRMRLAAVICDLDVGFREDERMNLKWQDVQFGGRPHVFITHTKTGKPRRVPLLDRVAKVLQELPVHPSSPYVFTKTSGRRFGSFRNGILAAAARAGIEDLTEHDLRRTCGCRLLQKHKRSMAEVSKWLGHSSIKVTERHYAFLVEEDLDDVVAADRARVAASPSAEILHLKRG